MPATTKYLKGMIKIGNIPKKTISIEFIVSRVFSAFFQYRQFSIK